MQLANSGQSFLAQSVHVAASFVQSPVGNADMSMLVMTMAQAFRNVLAEASGTAMVVPNMASIPRIQKQ